MVSPLVVIALLWERYNLSGSLLVRGRPLSLGFGRWRWRLHSTNLLAGLLFLGVGTFVIVSAFSGGFTATEGQNRLGEFLRSAANAVIEATRGLPDIWFTLLLAAAAFYLIVRAFALRLGGFAALLRRRAAGATGYLRRRVWAGVQMVRAVREGPNRAGGYEHD
jgi:hypothetical protein